jgi:hypothetical protein
MKDNACIPTGYTCVPNYRLTLLDNRGLIERLATETSFVVDQLRTVWPELRSDPLCFGYQLLRTAQTRAALILRQPRTLLSGMAAIMIVSTAILLVVMTPKLQPVAAPDLELVEMLSSKSTPEIMTKDDSGIGANSNGRVGIAKGSGEGSKVEPQRSRGGGSSGKRENFQTQHGNLIPPSVVPAPFIKPPKNPVLPSAGIDIDPALWAAQPILQYGDPRSTSSPASHGPGEGGNFGSSKGFGTGEGDDNGFGPGINGKRVEAKKKLGVDK